MLTDFIVNQNKEYDFIISSIPLDAHQFVIKNNELSKLI